MLTYRAEKDAPWGLARLSSRAKGAKSYIYDESAGEGTFSYVVGKQSILHGLRYVLDWGYPLTKACADTGIRTTHEDFSGRAVWGFNAVGNTTDTDNQGHGT
jgi:subtilisin family serine protease